MPLEIAYLISRYPSVSHTFIQREVKQLRSRGFVIHTASINPSDIAIGNKREEDHKEEARTYYVKRQGAFRAIGALLKTMLTHPVGLIKGVCSCCQLAGFDIKSLFTHGFYLAEALLIGTWMRRLKIRHIHVHFANPASTVALILSKIYPVTFSLTVHGPDEFYDVTRHHLKEKIAGARFIICISAYAKSQLMFVSDPALWSKFTIVRLGVDPSIYLPRRNKERIDTPVILCVGRLTPAKGHAILIDSLKLLEEQGMQAQLHLVGDGPERTRLTEQARRLGLQEQVVFLGALNPHETLEAYGKADIFALASFAEGLPVVLMEAMSQEIPCVAPGINGIPELIQPGTNGLLVFPADALSLSQALAGLIRDPDLRIKIGKAGRAMILKRFDLQENAQQLAEQFEQRLRRD